MTRKTRNSHVGGVHCLRIPQFPGFSISTVKRHNNSLIVQAYLNIHEHRLTINTGATKSIISKNFLKKISIKQLNKNFSLETTTVGRITVHGETRIRFTLDRQEIQANVLVADIVDDFIFGLAL